MFTSPSAKEGTRTHKHLGFLLDEQLSGKAHFQKVLAMGSAKANLASRVAARMGEDMALWCLESVIGPSVLYDAEMLGPKHSRKLLRALWEKLLGKAVLLGKVEQKEGFIARKDSFVKKGGIATETSELPWDIQMNAKAAGLWRRIHLDL